MRDRPKGCCSMRAAKNADNLPAPCIAPLLKVGGRIANLYDASHVQHVHDRDAYVASSRFGGTCSLQWRQGVKHDAAAVMELQCHSGGTLTNKCGEEVIAEDEYVFPLLKSSDLHRDRIEGNNRRIIVPQRSLSEDTGNLQRRAPALFTYLTAHQAVFGARKSSIYRGKPPFSIFGVGLYSFAAYKVAVAGLYPIPRFRIVGPNDGKPVLFDDTCYFVACDDPWQAGLVASLLNSDPALAFIGAMTFPGSKRPITKTLLQKIDLLALLDAMDGPEMLERLAESVRKMRGQGAIEVGVPPADLRGLLSGSRPAEAMAQPQQPRLITI